MVRGLLISLLRRRKKAYETTRVIYTIAFTVFGLTAFTVIGKSAVNYSDSIKASLSQEISDRVIKAMMLIDNYGEGAISLELPAKYDLLIVRPKKNEREYVIRIFYKGKEESQSKSFHLDSDVKLFFDLTVGEYRWFIKDTEKVCIVKIRNEIYLLPDSEKKINARISLPNEIDIEECKVK